MDYLERIIFATMLSICLYDGDNLSMCSVYLTFILTCFFIYGNVSLNKRFSVHDPRN